MYVWPALAVQVRAVISGWPALDDTEVERLATSLRLARVVLDGPPGDADVASVAAAVNEMLSVALTFLGELRCEGREQRARVGEAQGLLIQAKTVLDVAASDAE